MKKDKLDHIERQINNLTKKLVLKHPSHFQLKDIGYEFIASFLFTFIFLFKGNMINIANNLTLFNIYLIVISTIIFLTLEIYFIGYDRMPKEEKRERYFAEFWVKRFISLYSISLIVPIIIILIYNIELSYQLVFAVSFPSAIGAAIPSFLKQY